MTLHKVRISKDIMAPNSVNYYIWRTMKFAVLDRYDYLAEKQNMANRDIVGVHPNLARTNHIVDHKRFLEF